MQRAQQALRSSDFGVAEGKFRAVVALDSHNPTAHFQLGTVYRQLGRVDDSRRELAAFQKLEDSRKRIDQVYVRTRGEFPETDPTGPDAPNK